MFKSVHYVIRENFANLYRIYSIAKYELLADVKDSKFGFFWNFASPAIQVFTYWIVFGIGLLRKPQQGIEYLPWVVVGFAAWWYIQPCITNGCSAIFSKKNVISKMKFPVSILPATVCVKELFNHVFMLGIALVVLLIYGFYPNIYWLNIIYFAFCAFMFVESLALILAVLNMISRDVKKLVTSFMRMLLYFSPVLWEAHYSIPVLNFITKLNPIYYIVNGYREAIFFDKPFWQHSTMMLYFWIVVILMFLIGSAFMFRFKHKFIDMI